MQSKKQITVLSLFDGMSCGQMALNRVGLKEYVYYASEIKPHGINVTQQNYPNTIQIGDVTKISYKNGILKTEKGEFNVGKIDLLIGESPCKGISILNQKQDGLNHSQSILFWEYVRIYKEVKEYNNRVRFLLENTHGNKQATETISETLKTKPLSINSKLVSAQNRPRYYWTNIIGVEIPKDRGLTTKDVFDFDGGLVPINRVKWLESESGKKSVSKGYTRINPFPKSGCLTASGHKKWNENYILRDGVYKYLSQRDIERLQTVEVGYTNSLTFDEAYDLLGDGWTVDVIVEFFKPLLKEFSTDECN